MPKAVLIAETPMPTITLFFSAFMSEASAAIRR
jgi:hypothetical protein